MERDAGRRVFGTDPCGYAQGRPEYPSRVYEILEATCLLRSDSTVFEIGAGTGQATEPLLARAGSVDAIEPDHRLATLLEERLLPHAPRLRLHRTVFEEAALPPGAFDLGVAATSFHWVAVEPALRKVFRLLRPGGHWAMWWTVFGNPNGPDDFQHATQALFSALERSPSQGEADKSTLRAGQRPKDGRNAKSRPGRCNLRDNFLEHRDEQGADHGADGDFFARGPPARRKTARLSRPDR